MSATIAKPIIIGIAGGTGAGKSTFAKSIYHGFGGDGGVSNSNNTNFHDCDDSNTTNIAHLSHDDYYKDLSHLPMEERALINFDHPDSLDNELFIQHLDQLSRGLSIQVPRYDFKRHCRYQEGEEDELGRKGGRIVESKRVILVEGILILSISGLVKLMDLKVFVVR
jgi:uridine kinase